MIIWGKNLAIINKRKNPPTILWENAIRCELTVCRKGNTKWFLIYEKAFDLSHNKRNVTQKSSKMICKQQKSFQHT